MTLTEFLAELRLTARIYPFGFSLQHYLEATECGGALLRRHYVLHCFTGLTRALDPVEAVYFRRSYVEKTLPERRMAHPRDVGAQLGLSARLVDRIIASSAQSIGCDDRLRAKLWRVCGVNFSHVLAAAAKWRPPTTAFTGEQVCPRPFASKQLQLPL